MQDENDLACEEKWIPPTPMTNTCEEIQDEDELEHGDSWIPPRFLTNACGKAKQDEEIFCGPCVNEDTHIKATHFCKTCEDPEPFCKSCAKQHTRQKICKDHEICGDMNDYPKQVATPCENAKQDEEIFCGPCVNEDTHIKATHFCKTCEDPEPFCESCAKQHTRQKICKDHEICGDMNDYPQQVATPCGNAKQDEEIFCGPCVNEDTHIKATHFCKTCEDPEPLCESCAKQHTRQKICKDHEICGEMNDYPQQVAKPCGNVKQEIKTLCNPCLIENLQIMATCFCSTCDAPEPFCETCAKQHNRQKISRHHQLCREMKNFRKPNASVIKQNKKEIKCDPCSYDNVIVKATHFCETCDNPQPLCEKCASHHTRHEICKNHKICQDMLMFPIIKKDKREMKQQKENERGLRSIKNVTTTAPNFYNTCIDFEKSFRTNSVTRKHIRPTRSTYQMNMISPLSKSLSMNDQRKPTESRNTWSLDTDRVQAPHSRTCYSEPFHKQCTEDEIVLKEIAVHQMTPGKPFAHVIRSNSVELNWATSIDNVDYYQIRYKCLNNESWTIVRTDSNHNRQTIHGLMENTNYTFQVRGLIGNFEGPYGPASDNILTKESKKARLFGYSQVHCEASPSSYHIPLEENRSARNENAKIKQMILGQSNEFLNGGEKTILLLGVTNSGKNILVDGIINYFMGVSFEDPFRFTTASLEEERMKMNHQTDLQSEWITVYKLYPAEESDINYTLNIIDIPDFGYAEAIDNDNRLMNQIQGLFLSQNERSTFDLDALCIVIRAIPTVKEEFAFSSMLSLFGKDIEPNICMLSTSDTGPDSTMSTSSKDTQCFSRPIFIFDSSALFADNQFKAHNSLAASIHQINCKSFRKMFKQINTMEPKTINQTKYVLHKRERLKKLTSEMRGLIIKGSSLLSDMEHHLRVLMKLKSKTNATKNFCVNVNEIKEISVKLPKGQGQVVCLHCDVICHENCTFDENNECNAMLKGSKKCAVCPKKCPWSAHKPTQFTTELVNETVTKRNDDMENEYTEALGQTLLLEKYLEQLADDANKIVKEITLKMMKVSSCKNKIQEHAFRQDPSSDIEKIQFLSQLEEMEKAPGFNKRLKMLDEIRKVIQTDKDVEDFYQLIQATKENMQSVTGKNFP